MTLSWPFDQARNVACITCKAIVEGAPVLLVTHYEDDDSWAFLDGQTFDVADALVVAMFEVVDMHPELCVLSTLPPGWTAQRLAADLPWTITHDA